MSSIKTQSKSKHWILLELESVLNQLKRFRGVANEEDKITFFCVFGQMRKILINGHITKPLRTKEVKTIESCLEYLHNYVRAMALDNLFHEVKELKKRIDVMEHRVKQDRTVEIPKSYLLYGKD